MCDSVEQSESSIIFLQEIHTKKLCQLVSTTDMEMGEIQQLFTRFAPQTTDTARHKIRGSTN